MVKAAWHAAQDLGQVLIRPEHLLLALLHETEGAVGQAFARLAVDREGVRRKVLERLGRPLG